MRRCERCDVEPVAHCARCGASVCLEHIPTRGLRCRSCEAEWTEGVSTRRAVKQMFAPASFVLAGGAAFGALLPIVAILPAFIGALVVAAVSTTVGVMAAAGMTGLVDGVARAQFLREHARGLPEARVVRALPPPRR
ncbi:MAG TPA: hypothetical protein VL463_26865 [Kofleriaceae bacterium]|jgi:hypothetical protein|nr:hypothetical protein [Kofleriaceae bacterium]